MLGLSLTAVDDDPIAVRGDRLAVVMLRYRASDFEVPLVALVSVDADGRADRGVVYEPADLVEALVDLDEWYAEGEGADHADMVRLGGAFVKAHAERDWDALRAVWADDAILEDHRLAGWGRIEGIDALMERNRAMVELAPDYLLIVRRYLALAERHELVEFSTVGTTAEGARYDVPRVMVTTLRTPTGPFERTDYFDLEQIDQAWQRFRELTGELSDDNLAMVMSRRWFPALVEGDWDTVAGLLAPLFVLEDRRPMFVNRFDGLDAAMEWFRATASLGLGGVDLEPIAMRGDRLAVLRRSWLANDYEMTSLCLVEVGDDGRAVFSVLWDGDEIDTALSELDRRFLEGEGAPYAPWMERSLRGVLSVHARHDWTGLREVYADDIVLLDHRPTGTGEYRGIDAALDYHRTMIEVAPTLRHVVRRQLAIGDHIVLAELVSSGEGEPGGVGSYEIVSLLVTTNDAEGRTTRMERFGADDLDAAWACYRQLGGQA